MGSPDGKLVAMIPSLVSPQNVSVCGGMDFAGAIALVEPVSKTVVDQVGSGSAPVFFEGFSPDGTKILYGEMQSPRTLADCKNGPTTYYVHSWKPYSTSLVQDYQQVLKSWGIVD